MCFSMWKLFRSTVLFNIDTNIIKQRFKILQWSSVYSLAALKSFKYIRHKLIWNIIVRVLTSLVPFPSPIYCDFQWVSNVIRVYLGSSLPLSDWLSKNSRHFLNQSEVKPKPIETSSRKFTRASCRLRKFPFRKQAMPFLTIDAFPGNSRCHWGWLMPNGLLWDNRYRDI